jgi:signal transduction histidine kinase
MSIVPFEPAVARDPRLAGELADRATSQAPAWLWSADGLRILWANVVGAAIFDAGNAGDIAALRFEPAHPATVEITRLAAILPPPGQARLERLRGFGASFGRALACVCSRVVVGDAAAILVAANEPAGPALSLRERVSRLFAGDKQPLAVFAPDGTFLYATKAVSSRLGASPTWTTLGIADLMTQALAAGSAGGATSYGPATAERVGSGDASVLVVAFPANFGAVQAGEAAANRTLAAWQLPPVAAGEILAERRHPLRFVWQMDADGRFMVGSDEFIELMGPRTMAAFGRLWSEVAAALKIDPQNEVARAVATHETWSGITVSWPMEAEGERLPVELSGLPVFDRDRNFRGYRGFGVCRDIARINRLARARQARPIGFMPPAEQPTEAVLEVTAPPVVEAVAQALARSDEFEPSSAAAPAANVVPFRVAAPEPKAPSLSPVERNAFRELAQELTARLQGGRQADASSNGAPENDAPAIAPTEPETPASEQPAPPAFESVLLERIPLGVLIYRQDTLLYANRYFLELSGYRNLDALTTAGGLHALFAEPEPGTLAQSGGTESLSVMTCDGERRPVEGRLFSIPFGDTSALALILSNGVAEERRRASALSLAGAESEIRELKTRLESQQRGEDELRTATREAQQAAVAKAEFVSKVSHEIRTPLNAITGFAEVIAAERFGPLGNERYRDYVKDIHAAGMHLVSLLNDLLDLSKIETGQLDLTFANVSLNELTQQCVGIMQPQASRARIIIRTSLTPGLPQVVADERSLRQIVLNLLSNSIRFTGPGGQVIISTAYADNGEAVLRVRDTGVGMSDKDVEAALEPFRQTAVSGSWGSGGTGLGLPLTKALAEANRAHFSIKSAPNAGTLVEVAFPPARVAR